MVDKLEAAIAADAADPETPTGSPRKRVNAWLAKLGLVSATSPSHPVQAPLAV
jgi:hypothetical protein